MPVLCVCEEGMTEGRIILMMYDRRKGGMKEEGGRVYGWRVRDEGRIGGREKPRGEG